MTTHVTREQWNARPPDSTTPLTRSKVDKFIVHYSGASRAQSVRSIQDYCMDVKGHVDIDYNRIVKDGLDYMGRGWNVGGHTKDNNSTSYGVCVVGLDGDATDDDKTAVRDIYEEICATLGRRITMTTHRGVLGASYTDCPGTDLHNWVMAGMPYPMGVDMTPDEVADAVWRRLFPNPGMPGTWTEAPAFEYLRYADKNADEAARLGKQALEALDALSVPQPVPVDPATIKAALLDPEVLAAIAKAVNDDNAERMKVK